MTKFARRLAADTYQRTLESIAPNAARLKSASNTHLGRALLLASNLALLVVCAFWAAAYATAEPAVETDGDVIIDIIEYEFDAPAAEPPVDAPDVPNSGGTAVSSAGDAGTPTPVPDALAPAETTLARNEDLPFAGRAGPVGDAPSAGDGTGTERLAARPSRPALPLRPPPPPVVEEDAPAPVNPPEPTVLDVAEIDPELVGGIEALQRGIEYPRFERETGISGQVLVQFVVDEEGRPVRIEVVRSVSPGLDRAAVRAVERARFTPGEQNGRRVRVRMTLPVTFRLR